MKLIERLENLPGQAVPPRIKVLNPRQRLLIRICCSSLTLLLSVGAVPFLKGFAAEEEIISGSDVRALVSGSDAVSATDLITGTAEPRNTNAAVIDSGSCGANVTWTFDDEGTLTISGLGAMENRSYHSAHKNDIKKVIIEDGVTSIYEHAFTECGALTTVSIPDSVTSIADRAFNQCSSLQSVSIPDSVTSIGKYSFAVCSALTSTNIPNGVTSIPEGTYWKCSSLTSITIPESVTLIGQFAFDESGLTSITIPEGVTTIDNDAFDYCKSLTTVTIPDSVTSIGRTAFFNCSSLTDINIPDSITELSYGLFAYCSSLPSITIPDSVTTIHESAFYGCSSLTSVTVPDTVTSINFKLFTSCTNLTSATLGTGITSIPSLTFGGCTNLQTVTIGYVTSVAEDAFSDAPALETVYYPCDHDVSGIQNTTNFPTDPEFVPMHDWSEWEETTPPGALEPGEMTRTCRNDSSHTETQPIPATGNLIYEPIEGNGSSHVVNIGTTVTIKFDRTDVDDDEFVYQEFLDAGSKVVVKKPNGERITLKDGRDFTATEGSLVLKLHSSFLETLEVGEYQLIPTFTAGGFTVDAKPGVFYVVNASPSTGESILPIIVMFALMTLAGAGAAFAILRRRISKADAE